MSASDLWERPLGRPLWGAYRPTRSVDRGFRPYRGHSLIQRSNSEPAVLYQAGDLGFWMAFMGGLAVYAFPQGTVHEAGEDLQAAVRSNPKVLILWERLTPLGRNEFICWVDDAKQPMTRQRRIKRTCDELLEGKKRPCCWAGCIHRTDKAPSRWQKAVLIDQKGKKGS
jgi:Bacteriocin-protection, YdeI or OmpD-Associated